MRTVSSWLMSGLVMSALSAFSPTVHAQSTRRAQTTYEVCRQAVVQTVGRLPTQVMELQRRDAPCADQRRGGRRRVRCVPARERTDIPQSVGMSPECGAASRRSLGAPGDRRDVEGCVGPLHVRRHSGGRTHQRRRPRRPAAATSPASAIQRNGHLRLRRRGGQGQRR